MTELGDKLVFDRRRVDAILALLERMAAGDMTVMLPISDNHDELDAVAHAINVLSDELRYTSSKMAEAESRRVAALLKDKA
jgi:nitrate/nitrite-specific signal transduction histidine kinase